MRIEYMREYVELARSRNFTKTADALFISQPALSRHIASIEAELGVRLFDRSKQNVELTRQGTIVLGDFKQIVSQYDGMMDQLNMTQKGMSGDIAVGMPYYAVDRFIAPVLKRFVIEYPNIKLELSSYQPDMLFDELLAQKVDVAFLHLPGEVITGHPGFVFQKLADDSLMVLGDGKSHHLEETISLREFSGMKLAKLSSSPQSVMEQYNAYVERLLSTCGIDTRAVVEVENVDLLSSVLEETGSSIILPGEVADYHPRLKHARLEEGYSVGLYAAASADNDNPAIPLFFKQVLCTFKERPASSE